MAALLSLTVCLLGLSVMATICLSEDTSTAAVTATTAMAPAYVTTDGGNTTSGIIAGGSGFGNGYKVTDLDELGQQRKQRKGRNGRKRRKGRKGRKRQKGKRRKQSTKQRKGRKLLNKSSDAQPRGPQMRELFPSRMSYQECVRWSPNAKIFRNTTDKTLLVDYCNEDMPIYPDTRTCLLVEHAKPACQFVGRNTCSLGFKNFTQYNYTVTIQAICDNCVMSMRKPCSSPIHPFSGNFPRDLESKLQLDSEEQPAERTLEIALGAGGGFTAVTIVIIAFCYYIRRRKTMSSRSSCQGSDGVSRELQELRSTLPDEQHSEQHRYERVLPRRDEHHQTRPKTTAGRTETPSNTYPVDNRSFASYTTETETSFTEQDRLEASPLLQNSSENAPERSEEVLDDNTSGTLPFVPAASSERQSRSQFIGSFETIDYEGCSPGSTSFKEIPSSVKESKESLSNKTLRECMRANWELPGIMGTQSKAKDYKYQIPINTSLIKSMTAEKDRKNAMKDCEQTSEGATMSKCDRLRRASDT